ncbi:MAG: phosphatidate cytidylyltransferase [Lachnospiraceae bacterium]|nr:phosphatidate cytidylyltransferase [Lachnospiraceae bacterium]
MPENLLTRILSGACLTAVTFACNYFGGPLLLIVLLIFSLIGLCEYYRATGVIEKKACFSPVALTGYLMSVIWYVALYLWNDAEHALFLLVAVLILTMMIYVFTFPKLHATTIAYAMLGFLYVPVMLGFIYRVRSLENGIYTVWLIYIASWVCDTFAYLVGIAIGKHKLAPVLSPKKSVEGSVGGIAGAMLAGYLFSVFALNNTSFAETAGILIVCGVGAVVSQTGDLAASAIKRNHDIKDYGHLIPGHGGILDRFDSVIFTAPMIYFLLVWIVEGRF